MRLLPLAFLLVVAKALAGCGGDAGRDEASRDAALAKRTEVTLVLDFIPNAVHTGIYCALEDGHYERANIDLDVVEPTSTSDTLKLIDQGRAAFGIADGIDIGVQIDRGLGGRAIMAIAQRPLGGVITLADAGIDSPSDLEGRTVGITGVPSDEAVLETIVSAGGGDPGRVEEVTIGFNTVVALESGRVDAITAFLAADGTQLELDGFETVSFALDEWGGPSYPGLVVFSSEERIARDPELMQAFVDATVRGYVDTLDDPDRCLDALLARVPEIDPELAREQLDAYLALFEAGAPRFGDIDRAAIEELSRFLHETGLTETRIPPERYATEEFVEAGAREGG